MEVEALEHTKDEEAKHFERHKILFDFNVLIRIKESMVDVSSSLMASALEVSEGYLILFRISCFTKKFRFIEQSNSISCILLIIFLSQVTKVLPAHKA